MVKVESNMLVLDTTFSKQDAEAINHFVDIAKAAERERVIAILKEELRDSMDPIQGTKGGWREHLIALIKGENK
jgi:hypothetical protein